MTFRHAAIGVLAMLAAAMFAAVFARPASAQERQMLRDKMIQWGDYDQFVVSGPGGARNCAETCANDPRCKAWTFIRPVNQCRLKHSVGPVVDNPCCVSGVKPDAEAADAGGKPAHCADYARAAIAANEQNMSQGCQLQGPRWSDDFQAHYSWCMGAHREQSATETQARASDIARCQQASNEDAGAKCDHFARISMVQVDSARKAHCALPPGDRRWANDIEVHRRACLEAPARVLATGIADREAVLTGCLAAAGEARQACDGYGNRAMEQVRAATASGCDIGGPRWSSSRAQQVQWCLSAAPATRRAEADARTQQLVVCTQQAAKRQQCGQYAEAATSQALRNVNENCGFEGPDWSRYKDEHAAFCMQAGESQLRQAIANRDAALQQCQSRAAVDPECDDYARRAVRIGEINAERSCGLDGQGWSSDYQDHYEFCLRSNPVERRRRAMEQRQALFACSTDHGFTLELGF